MKRKNLNTPQKSNQTPEPDPQPSPLQEDFYSLITGMLDELGQWIDNQDENNCTDADFKAIDCAKAIEFAFGTAVDENFKKCESFKWTLDSDIIRF